MYDEAARNAIDFGEYSVLPSDLWRKGGVSGSNVHMVGHSLGGSPNGKGRKDLTELTEQSIGRITGLDPAGPRSYRWPNSERPSRTLKKQNKSGFRKFVDIIHTDGSCSPACFDRPEPLRSKSSWTFRLSTPSRRFRTTWVSKRICGALCNHGRSAKYFHSVWEPELFQVKNAVVEACSNSSWCPARFRPSWVILLKVIMMENGSCTPGDTWDNSGTMQTFINRQILMINLH